MEVGAVGVAIGLGGDAGSSGARRAVRVHAGLHGRGPRRAGDTGYTSHTGYTSGANCDIVPGDIATHRSSHRRSTSDRLSRPVFAGQGLKNALPRRAERSSRGRWKSGIYAAACNGDNWEAD